MEEMLRHGTGTIHTGEDGAPATGALGYTPGVYPPQTMPGAVPTGWAYPAHGLGAAPMHDTPFTPHLAIEGGYGATGVQPTQLPGQTMQEAARQASIRMACDRSAVRLAK